MVGATLLFHFIEEHIFKVILGARLTIIVLFSYVKKVAIFNNTW